MYAASVGFIQFKIHLRQVGRIVEQNRAVVPEFIYKCTKSRQNPFVFVFVANSLEVAAYFHRLNTPNIHSWSSLLRAYGRMGAWKKAENCFNQYRFLTTNKQRATNDKRNRLSNEQQRAKNNKQQGTANNRRQTGNTKHQAAANNKQETNTKQLISEGY